MRATVPLVLSLVLVAAAVRLAPAQSTPDDETARARASAEALLADVLRYHARFEVWPEMLEDLVDTPDGDKLIDALEPDPWGRPYRLVHGTKAFRIVSDGPDGQPETDDDVSVEHEL